MILPTVQRRSFEICIISSLGSNLRIWETDEETRNWPGNQIHWLWLLMTRWSFTSVESINMSSSPLYIPDGLVGLTGGMSCTFLYLSQKLGQPIIEYYNYSLQYYTATQAFWDLDYLQTDVELANLGSWRRNSQRWPKNQVYWPFSARARVLSTFSCTQQRQVKLFIWSGSSWFGVHQEMWTGSCTEEI